MLLVGLVFAVVLGLVGTSPGKAAMGLRVVRARGRYADRRPAALLRTLVLGVAALPTACLGVATLAQTAVMDPGRQRRGWHDHLCRSVVVDVRPVQEITSAATDERAPPGRQPDRDAAGPDPGPGAGADPSATRSHQPVTGVGHRVDRPGPPPSAGPPGSPITLPPGAPPGRTPMPPGPPPGLGPPPVPVSTVPRHAATSSAEAERTVVGVPPASRPLPSSASWRVTFDTGETFLVEGLGLVGRRPEGRPGEPVRHLVPLPSEDMSVSKTHAQFQVAADGVLVVMDRGSTNGSMLIRSGVARDLPPGKPTTLLSGDLVRFGDRSMTVVRES